MTRGERWIGDVLRSGVTSSERVQSRRGYGEIRRVQLDDGRSCILKSVEPPALEQPANQSHARKLRSYEVESAFYARYAQRCDSQCRVPAVLHLERTQRGWRFLLEDLDASGFPGRRGTPTEDEFDACLQWLAGFHARFLGATPDGLWPTGTYWHLATRPDELAATNDGPLRDAAHALDRVLTQCRFQTFVHGDAKVANFCFGPERVAAVDFQYVGGGCGMKDVAYFFSSCLSDEECERRAPQLLDRYFELLRSEVQEVDAEALEAEWRALYPAAWADFHRFLAGWAPGHWKIHDYTRRMTRVALERL